MHKDIKRKSIISTISLFVQSGYSAVLGLVANLIVTILLTPKIYGMYITVLSMISFLNYFSDIGLAASLIQKKEITDDDMKTTFTFQQLLTLVLILIGFALTGIVMQFYKLPVEGKYLYWSLLVAFFISSTKTIPSVLLERQMNFHKLVIVQITENTVFYASVVVFALMGYGLTSFTIAVMLRSIVGLILLFSISFWRPIIGFHMESFKRLIKFGIPYQGVSFLALFKDDLLTLYLGRAIGFEALGYVGWAKKWADAPLRIIMDNISRVAFPLISRFQDDKDKLGSIMNNILSYQTLVIAPVMVGISLSMIDVVHVIPKYLKWAPAVPLFTTFAISSLIVSLGVPYMNMYNAAGRVKTTFLFMMIMTIVTWVGTAALIPVNKLWAFPIAHIATSTSLLLIILTARKDFHTNPALSTIPFLFSSLLMGIVVESLATVLHTPGATTLFIKAGIGIVIYWLSLRFVFQLNVVRIVKALYEK